MRDASEYYVQARVDDGWEAVYYSEDKNVARLVSEFISERWEVEARFITAFGLRREPGGGRMDAVHRADEDLAALDPETRRQIEQFATEAQEIVADALPRVTEAKKAVAAAEQELRRSMLEAQEAGYTLREIGTAAGLSQTRVHQVISDYLQGVKVVA